MASASSKSAKTLFADSKMRLSERVHVNVNNIASLSRQIQRGSKSSELMMTSARQMASQDPFLLNTEASLKTIQATVGELQRLQSSLVNSVALLEEVKEQISSMQR